MVQELTDFERLVARMFFNVGVQSSLALEDPNQRFGHEFQHKEALDTPQHQSFDAIERRSYANKMDDGTVTLLTNPKDLPAITRVVMQGGNAQSVMSALDEAFAAGTAYTTHEGSPMKARAGHEQPEGSGNRYMKLVLNADLNAKHDVAVLFAWGGSSDKRITLDLMTWPMDKTADIKT